MPRSNKGKAGRAPAEELSVQTILEAAKRGLHAELALLITQRRLGNEGLETALLVASGGITRRWLGCCCLLGSAWRTTATWLQRAVTTSGVAPLLSA